MYELNKVKELPESRHVSKVLPILHRFLDMKTKFALVEDEGNRSKALQALPFKEPVQKNNLPVNACIRNGKVYLINEDM